MKKFIRIQNVSHKMGIHTTANYSLKTILMLLLFCNLSVLNAQRIAAGWSHSLYLCNNGSTVNSWGRNEFGQLGNGTTNVVPNPVPGVVSGITGVKAIRGGYQHVLALRNDSTVWTWGDNADGQLGIGTNVGSSVPVKVNALSGIIAVSGGQAGYHSLALRADGTVWTWGRNTEGQLGDGTLTSSNVPVQVTGLSNVIAIAGGEYHSLAIKSDGTAWAWGRNSNGQLGDSTTTNSSTPVQVKGLTGVTAIKGGRYFSFAILSDSTVWTWGQNGDGQLGNGTTTQSLIPVQVTGLNQVVAIAGSAFHCLALKSDGTVRSWGRGMDGQLGDGLGNTSPTTTPVQVVGLTNIVEIVSGTNYSMALKANDSIFSFGRNVWGYLGDGTTSQRNSPVGVASLCATRSAAPFTKKLTAGWSHSLFLCSNGNSANAWGANAFAQIGDGTITERTLPVTVSGLTNIKAIAAGYQHTLALKNDSTLWAWGDNTDGQLGDGTNTPSTTPKKINGVTSVIAVSGGQAGYHSLALKADGTVWAWGRNTEGQLGDGTLVSKNVPTQVTGLNNVIAIAGGEYHSLAVRNDGTIWAWGRNNEGQLGDGTTVTKSFPTQVTGATGFTAVAGGRYFSIALKNDSSVWTFGQNLYGQLGDGTTVNKSTLVQVSGLTKVTAVTGAAFHVLALKNDSTIVSWGRNGDGQLGNGTTAQSAVPVAVNSLTKVIGIAAGTNYSLAVKDNDSVYAWGRNPNGQLGDGTLSGKTNPNAVLNLCVTCNNTTSSLTTTACFKYTVPSGKYTYVADGVYKDTIPNAGGCDSIITINLTVNKVDTAVTQSGATLTASATGATYKWLNCSTGNSVISGATSQSYTATANGSYAVVVTKNSCSDTSLCYSVNSLGIAETLNPSGINVSVYPNPSSGIYNIQFPAELSTAKNVSVAVYNLLGELVFYSSTKNTAIDISNHSNGSYFMTIKADNYRFNHKLIKQ